MHHQIRTGYQDFRHFVLENNQEIHDAAMNYVFFEDVDLWRSFEQQLAHLDADSLSDELGCYLTSYGAEGWSDSAHGDYEYELEKRLDQLAGGLHAEFCKWIRTVRIPSRDQACGSLLNINPSGDFLNFNYTDTLERVYGVPQSKFSSDTEV